MIAVLTALYLALIWLVFFRLKLLPFNLTYKIACAVVGVVGITGILVAVAFCHPHSGDVRVFQYTVEVSSWLPKDAQVVEVPAQPNAPVKKGDVLFRLDPRPYEYEVRRLEATLAAADVQLPQLKADVKTAQAALKSAEADLENAQSEEQRARRLSARDAISEEQREGILKRLREAKAARAQASAQEERARLALESKVGGEFTSVVQARQELASARLNLEQTTVRAPADGYATNVRLRAGDVARPGQAVMTFVDTSAERVIVATYKQNPLRNVEPGQPVEVAFPMYPGRVFKAKVESVVPITGGGQLMPSGDLPEATTKSPRGRFAVRLKLDDPEASIPGGAGGSAAIYTDKMRSLAVVRKVMIRMESYANYLFGDS